MANQGTSIEAIDELPRAGASEHVGSGRSRIRSATASVLCATLLNACASGRPPVPPGVVPKPRPPTISEEQYGHTVLQGLSEQYKVDYTDPRVDKVTEIVERLTTAAGAGQDPWHVYLFRAPEVKNAAATRGNHVFVWSGLLDFTESDEETATFIAHEIAHVLAGHTDPDPNEEVRRLLIGIGAAAAGIAVAHATSSPSVAGNVGRMTQVLTQEVGSGLLVNPYSRERELEADHIGLFLMADAGYRPDAAVKFWERIQQNPSFASGLEFFSTHPPPANRLESLRALLPQAMARYDRRDQQGAVAAPAAPEKKDSFAEKYYGAQPPAEKTDTRAAPRGDSFNWEDAASDEVRSEPVAPPAEAADAWRVTAPRAVLYAEPDNTSRKLGEFRRGAEVRGAVHDKSWLRISEPDAGYLQLQDLAR